jgi:hypothetical protein
MIIQGSSVMITRFISANEKTDDDGVNVRSLSVFWIVIESYFPAALLR